MTRKPQGYNKHVFSMGDRVAWYRGNLQGRGSVVGLVSEGVWDQYIIELDADIPDVPWRCVAFFSNELQPKSWEGKVVRGIRVRVIGGDSGEIVDYSNSHGVHYGVRFANGTVEYYIPGELEVL